KFSFSLPSFFSRDENNPICTSRTIDSGCVGILKNFNGFNSLRIYGVQWANICKRQYSSRCIVRSQGLGIIWHPVYNIEWLVSSHQAVLPTDTDFKAATRRSGILDYIYSCYPSLESLKWIVDGLFLNF